MSQKFSFRSVDTRRIASVFTNCSMTTVTIPLEPWPLLKKSHPVLGVFHHNSAPPVLTSGCAKFFSGWVQSRLVHEEQKQLRHNPYIDLIQHRPELLRCAYESFGRLGHERPPSPITLLRQRSEDTGHQPLLSQIDATVPVKNMSTVDSTRCQASPRTLIRRAGAPTDEGWAGLKSSGGGQKRFFVLDDRLERNSITEGHSESKLGTTSPPNPCTNQSSACVEPKVSTLHGSINVAASLKHVPHFLDEYKLEEHKGRILGRGGYSCVRLGYHKKTHDKYAVKIVTKRYLSNRDIANVRREVAIHSTLNHPNVVRLIDHFEDAEAIQLIVEHCEGGDLDRHLRRPGYGQTLSEKTAVNVFKQILRAIAYIHQNDIIHADIKPENVLFKKDPFSIVKLCDFGLSMSAKDVRYFRRTGSVSKVPFETKLGTSGYVAPEMFKSQNFGKAIDLWALGIMLFRCLVGYTPFQPPSSCTTEPLCFHKPDWEGFSEHCQDFLCQLLRKNPSERLTANAALTHPWILGARL